MGDLRDVVKDMGNVLLEMSLQEVRRLLDEQGVTNPDIRRLGRIATEVYNEMSVDAIASVLKQAPVMQPGTGWLAIFMQTSSTEIASRIVDRYTQERGGR